MFNKKYPWVLHIYVPEEKQALIRKAKEIADREGRSLSKLILEWLEQYVRMHEPGNPQQRLDTILQKGSNYKVEYTCERCGAKVTKAYKGLFISGNKLIVCEKCLNHAKKHGLLKKLINVLL